MVHKAVIQWLAWAVQGILEETEHLPAEGVELQIHRLRQALL